jgi:hypothetical protein
MERVLRAMRIPSLKLNRAVLTVVVIAAAVLIACGKNADTSETSASAPSATPAAPQPAPLSPGISKDLKHDATAPVYNFDSLGPIQYPAGQKANQVSADSVIGISGWAQDAATKGLAGGVEVVLDGTPYTAKYGIPRGDVADHFKRPEIMNCGYLLELRAGQLTKGPHSVSVRILSADKKSYTEGPTVQFTAN